MYIRNRFPVKPTMDALALTQIFLRSDINCEKKKACVKFYRDPMGLRDLYASITRAGSHWSFLGMHIALDLAAGGDGEYVLHNSFWLTKQKLRYTKLDWREPLEQRHSIGQVNDPFMLHTHLPYFRLRSRMLGHMNIAIGLRDILTSLESKFYKLSKVTGEPDTEDDERFAWDAHSMDCIDFYNSWGDVMTFHPSARTFKYEDMVAAPSDVHQEMFDFWGLNLPHECVKEAFLRTAKSKMAKEAIEIGTEQNRMRVSAPDKPRTIPPARRKRIEELISKHLIHDFGYGYLN